MVKIVTDSTSDLPQEIVKELDITIVPAYVIFNLKRYLDGVDITREEFYKRLAESSVPPSTTAPSPKEFALAYQEILKKDKEILVICLSAKLSRIYESAFQASLEVARPGYKIDVIDSSLAAMALGLLVIEAGTLAKAGAGLGKIKAKIKTSIKDIRLLAVLDTLEYAEKGGRLEKLSIKLAKKATSILNVKAVLNIKDGEISFAGAVRPGKKTERILNFISRGRNVEKIALEYSSKKQEAEMIREKIIASFPDIPIYLSSLSPGIGCHAGPGVIAVSIKERTA